MKLFQSLTRMLCMAFLLSSAAAVFADTGDMDSAEAKALEFSVLLAELKQWYYEDMSEHWQSPLFSELAADEQISYETLSDIAAQYGVEISDQYWGCNIVFAGVPALNFYCGLVMEWPWWDEWEEALSVGAYFEELAIHELQQAIEYTDEQLLIDTYTEMLGMTYSHLLKLAEQLYVHPLDYTAQLLDQSVVDAALIEAIATKADGFGINPGLNDAWYEPATNGQGFFLTVFPERKMVFLGWFTYDMAFPGQEAIAELGDACQRWLTAQGPYDGSQADLVIYNAKGGLFDQALPAPELEAIGTIFLQFENCKNGIVSYDLPGLGLSGDIPIQRLAPDNVAACEAQAYPSD